MNFEEQNLDRLNRKIGSRVYSFCWKVLSVGFILSFISGCAGMQQMPLPGTEIIDWARPEKSPDWLDILPHVEGDTLFFIGLVDKAKREDLGRADAEADARLRLALDLGSKIRAKYNIGREGNEGRYVEEAADMFSSVTLRGTESLSWFTVHYYIQPQRGGTVAGYLYKIYVLKGISEADWIKAKESSLKLIEEQLMDHPGRGVLERFREDLNSGNWPYGSD